MNPGAPVTRTASTIVRDCAAASRRAVVVRARGPAGARDNAAKFSARVPSSTEEARISLTGVGFHTNPRHRTIFEVVGKDQVER